mgnify:CR=1 FL=1
MLDQSIEYGVRMSKLIDEVTKDMPEEQEDDGTESEKLNEGTGLRGKYADRSVLKSYRGIRSDTRNADLPDFLFLYYNTH